MVSNITCTPASVLLTVPPGPTLKLVAVAGPRLIPLMVINSPGAMAPNAPLALLEIVDGCGAGTPVTVTVTLTVIAGWPVGVMVMAPVYVPAAVKLVGVIDAVKVNALPSPPVVPLVGVTESHPVVLAEVAVMAAAPPVLVTFKVWLAGAVPPN